MSEPIAIGKANIDGFQRRKTFKLEQKKNNEYRILPPLGKLASKGTWDVGVAVHWGYKNSAGKMRPFQCVEKIEWGANKEKIIVQECPRCKLTNKAQLLYNKKDAELKDQGVGDEIRKAKLQHIAAYLQQFNRGFRHYANAMNAAGEIGRLDYSARHRKLLVASLKDLQSKGIDALSPEQGVYFNFTYDGKDGHKVDVVTVSNSNGTFSLKTGPLTPAIIERLGNETFDLTDLFAVITVAQVQALVDNEKDAGLPRLVDSIFESSTREERTSTSTAVDHDDLDPELAAFGPTPDAAPAAAPVTTLAAAPTQATPVQAPTAAVVTTAVPATAPDAVTKLTDDEFDNLFK